MQVKELKPKQGNVGITLDIVDKGDVREFEKFGKQGKVCTAMAKDETGTIKLSLWNEQIEQVNKGDKVKIENGYVSEWQGELQLTTGKFGKLEVIGKAENIGAFTEDETELDNAMDEEEPLVDEEPVEDE